MELKGLNHGQEFPSAITEMSFRRGVMRGRPAEKCNDTAPAEQIVIRANSIFLMGGVRVNTSGDRWHESLYSKLEQNRILSETKMQSPKGAIGALGDPQAEDGLHIAPDTIAQRGGGASGSAIGARRRSLGRRSSGGRQTAAGGEHRVGDRRGAPIIGAAIGRGHRPRAASGGGRRAAAGGHRGGHGGRHWPRAASGGGLPSAGSGDHRGRHWPRPSAAG
jgi:hypothetical protein